jgi:hypothetical protein
VAKRLIRDVKGFVQDIEQVKALSDEFSNIRLLSDRSLYLLQNLSGTDCTFYNRYGTIDNDGFYTPVLDGTPDAEVVDSAVDILRRDLNSMALEDTLQCICDRLGEIAGTLSGASNDACSCDIGSDVETTDGQEGGPLPDPVNGVEYTAPDPIVDRKCKASNYVHGGLKAVVQQFDENSVTTLAFGGLALVLTVVSTILTGAVFGPFGVLVGAVVGAALSLSTLLFKDQVDMGDLLTYIEADEAGAICALYNAASASGARSAYSAHLDGQGASELMVEFVELIFSNNLLNLLFFEWGDSATAIEAATIIHDCSGCGFVQCEPAPIEINGVRHGSGDYTADDSTRTLSSVQDPVSLLHYISFHVEGWYPAATCAAIDGLCGVKQNFQINVQSYAGYNFAGHSGNWLCDAGVSIAPEIVGSGLPNPIGSYARTTGIEWVSTTPWTMDVKIRPTP